MSKTNNPPRNFEFDQEMVEFVIENCEANIMFGLNAINTIKSEDLLRKLIDNIEKFKKLKKIMEG